MKTPIISGNQIFLVISSLSPAPTHILLKFYFKIRYIKPCFYKCIDYLSLNLVPISCFKVRNIKELDSFSPQHFIFLGSRLFF